MNPPGKWVRQGKELYAFIAPRHSYYGDVHFIEGRWKWEARTMANSRIRPFGPAPQGFAPSLEQAKTIVEVLLIETNTVKNNE